MRYRVSIGGLVYGGKGMGRIDGKVIFVPLTAPGDEVMVEVTRERKDFLEGALVDIIEPSSLRREPVCEVFGTCGGCNLQHIHYNAQVEAKRRMFEDTLRRIGGMEGLALEDFIPSEKELFYRTRVRFWVDGRRWGFYRSGSHRVVDIEGCPLVEPVIDRTFRQLKDSIRNRHRGLYSVEMGMSPEDGRVVVSFHVSCGDGFDWEGVVRDIEEIKGFEVWLHGKERIHRWGERSLGYTACGLRFGFTLGAFSQVNHGQNINLIKKVLDYGAFRGRETVLDLFSGIGNLTLPCAVVAGGVVGVEECPEAVELAIKNASMNGLRDVDFVCTEVSSYLKGLKDLENKKLDVVILDPPRCGGLDAVRLLCGLEPERIIYVSCSPPTLARDLAYLVKHGYRVFNTCIIDMFPQTHHIESVVGLTHRSL